MESFPNFTFIGNVSEDKKKQFEKETIESLTSDVSLLLSDAEKRELEMHEIRKTPEQERLFKSVDEKLKDLQKMCGVIPYDFPLENIFILSSEIFEQKFPGLYGVALADKQRIFLEREDGDDYTLSLALFHELFHCKGKIAVQVPSEESGSRKNTLREGFIVHSSDKSNRDGSRHEHFRGVEEAVTATMEKLFHKKLLQSGEFPDVSEKFYSDEGKAEIQKIMKAYNIPFEEVRWFDSSKNNGTAWFFPYGPQRKVLDYVVHEIAAEKGVQDDDIFYKFLRDHFTGHLIELGKMVEDVFGKGSFRRLGDMDVDSKSAIQTLEALQKMRIVHKEKS